MGQQDPLVAWQREGYAMFGALMDGIDDDYLRYVMHVEAVTTETQVPRFERAVYEAADDPVVDVPSAPLNPPSADPAGSLQGADQMVETLVPVVKDPHTKLGRNDPCWCGSGKKFKFCHGAT